MHRCVRSTSLLDQDVHNRSMCHLLIFSVFNLFGSLGRKDFWVLSETTSVDTLSNFKTIRQSPQLSPFRHCLWCSQHRLSQRTSISSRQKTSRRNIQPTNSHWAILELHPNSKDKSSQTILRHLSKHPSLGCGLWRWCTTTHSVKLTSTSAQPHLYHWTCNFSYATLQVGNCAIVPTKIINSLAGSRTN